MKTIRRTRIIVRKRELTIVKNGENNVHFDNTELHVCPLCNSPIHPKPQIPVACDEKLLTGIEKKLLTEEN